MGKLLAICIQLAAQSYQVPPEVLWVIHDIEGGKVGTVAENTNGTVDLGPMQINSHWIDDLAGIYGVSEDKIYFNLRDNACFNVQVAAWILKTEIRGVGHFWTGVARYHSRNRALQMKYMRNLQKAWRRRYPDIDPGLVTYGGVPKKETPFDVALKDGRLW